MRIEVSLPSLGDDEDAVTKGVVSFWLQKPGAAVNAGDDLVELTTDKAAFVVPSPESGILAEYCVSEGAEVAVGDVICILEARLS